LGRDAEKAKQNGKPVKPGVAEGRLDELDLFDKQKTYFKMGNGQWIVANYRNVGSLNGPAFDKQFFRSLQWVAPATSQALGLDDQLANKGPMIANLYDFTDANSLSHNNVNLDLIDAVQDWVTKNPPAGTVPSQQVARNQQQGMAEGLEPNRESGKALQNLKNLALMNPALTFQHLRQAGRESIITDAINACMQLEQSYRQNEQLGNAIFVRALRDELDNFKKGYPINSSAEDNDNTPDLGDLRVIGKLGKISFQQGVAEAPTDDPKFQKMMGTIQQGTPTLMGGYVAVRYASEKPSKKIRGATVNGKAVPDNVEDPGRLMKDLKFTPDRIEQQLTTIGQKYGWDSVEPGQGRGYTELFFDTSREYTSETQRQLATNIVKTVNEINKFFASMNNSLQATGLPGYRTDVWQGIGPDNNINQIDDINQIANIAQGKSATADPGPAIGRMILKYLPEYEAENDELGYDPQDFVNAKKVASIYIAKGERAGLEAQGKLGSHVSEMIDELLSDHGGSGLRTIWDLDDSEGVAEAFQDDEANLWYVFDSDSGRLKQAMISNQQEQTASRRGYRDSQEGALKAAGIIRSKFNPNKFMQKQSTGWVQVFPYGQPGVKEDSWHGTGNQWSSESIGENKTK
jgi:hypothetical protein